MSAFEFAELKNLSKTNPKDAAALDKALLAVRAT
jgi:hypothetical protein